MVYINFKDTYDSFCIVKQQMSQVIFQIQSIQLF